MASSLTEEEEAFEDTMLYLLCYCISFVTFLVVHFKYFPLSPSKAAKFCLAEGFIHFLW
jgi:hypothetical protein